VFFRKLLFTDCLDNLCQLLQVLPGNHLCCCILFEKLLCCFAKDIRENTLIFRKHLIYYGNDFELQGRCAFANIRSKPAEFPKDKQIFFWKMRTLPAAKPDDLGN